jgi:hypothetical protein
LYGYKIILLALAGLILGFVAYPIVSSGYFVRWEELPPPPQKASEIVPVGDTSFYIKTSDGTIYYKNKWYHEIWVIEKDIPDPCTFCEITTPCDFSSPQFSFLTNHPKNVNTCFQVHTYDSPETVTNYAIAIDGDNNYWEWVFEPSMFESVYGLICFPPVGLLLGIIIGLAIFLPIKSKKIL